MSEIEKEKESKIPKKTISTIEIAGGAIFGAISVVVAALTAPILPRVPGWGIAYFDPVSIIWIACFLIFGVRAGLLCSVIGTVGLMPFDPFAPIGPIMKLIATICLIIVPIIILKLYKREEGVRKSQIIKKPRNYMFYGALGIVLRVIVMTLFNVGLFLTLFAPGLASVNLNFIGLAGITGWTAVIIGSIIINIETSIWDLLIPYLLVFGTKIDEKYEIW
jgi:riboflavin transporter FmnP